MGAAPGPYYTSSVMLMRSINLFVPLKIHNLAVNALLKSDQINEIEGSVVFGLDEAMSCSPAFHVLKQLIQRCLTDAVSFENIFADAMLQKFCQWLCSPWSKLHDPALYAMLHKVMQKVLALLRAELENLGAVVILLNFTRNVIIGPLEKRLDFASPKLR
ncbi:DNA polymerase epsilon catalytic subunit [Tanacetum coccineum]